MVTTRPQSQLSTVAVMTTFELKSALRKADVRELDRLIKCGMCVNSLDNRGTTPLYLAVKYGNAHAVVYLSQRGADVNKPTSWGSTALHEAADMGNLAMAITLLNIGARVNQKDANGETALHSPSSKNLAAIVQLLLDSGADATIRNHKGRTPYDEAVLNECSHCMKILRRYMGPESRNGDKMSSLGVGSFTTRRDTVSLNDLSKTTRPFGGEYNDLTSNIICDQCNNRITVKNNRVPIQNTAVGGFSPQFESRRDSSICRGRLKSDDDCFMCEEPGWHANICNDFNHLPLLETGSSRRSSASSCPTSPLCNLQSTQESDLARKNDFLTAMVERLQIELVKERESSETKQKLIDRLTLDLSHERLKNSSYWPIMHNDKS